MKSVEFCYWLQGMFELAEPVALGVHQTESIRRHLALVFKHEIDASYPAHEQSVLNHIHSGPPVPHEDGPFHKTPDNKYRC